MDQVKNRGRSKYLACFSPVFDDDDATEGSARKKKPRRSFAAATKAVFSKTSFVKALRRKKSWKDSFRSNSVLSSESEKSMKTKKITSFSDREDSLSRSDSNPGSLFSQSIREDDSSISSSRSSSISSSISEQSIPIPIRKPPPKSRATGNSRNHELSLCILLVCLIALVFCGKVFAIATCTSTWLFFAPGRRYHRSQTLEFDSEEDSKRMIFTGEKPF